MPKSRAWLFVGLGLLLIVASLALSPLLLSPSIVPTLARSSTRTIVQSPTRVITATWDVSSLPTVTPPAPDEPTLPPEALAMHAAPTATPGSPPSPLLGTPTATPFPTPASINPSGTDDVPMVDVPAGEFVMGTTYEADDRRQLEWNNSHPDGPHQNFHNETPQLAVRLDAFSIDKLEVTNARYRRCVGAGICSPTDQVSDVPLDYSTSSAYDDFPVMGADWYGADAYCQWVGKRLPAEAEWEEAARGTDGRLYPWGDAWDASRITEQENPRPVGSFPLGASPYGALDMLGNAPEWTAGWYQPYPQQVNESSVLNPDSSKIYKVIRGKSSYAYHAVVTYRTPQYPFQTAGFRCAKGPTPPPVLRFVVVSTTAIRPLPTATAADLSKMVYIPAGEFIMGTDMITGPFPQDRVDEMPQHAVYLDAFYIDRFPATYAEYVQFLNLIGHNNWACTGQICAGINNLDEPDPYSTGDFHIKQRGGQYVVDEGFQNHAADAITWNGASAYCSWLGKRLPTEAEWEKAARGTDGRRYPWGNEWDERSQEDEVFFQHDVGFESFNASPYGVRDMLGHGGGEWANDWYDRDYYKYSPLRNPPGPQSGRSKTVRGGSGIPARHGLTARNQGLGVRGFRCAYTPH